MWSAPDIADAVQNGLRATMDAIDREQAVLGLDARDELQLHPLLAETLVHAGYGVAREQRYPAARRKRRESEGERCDLVLTPDRRPLREPASKATLFDAPNAVDLDEAFWLEVKVVAQFTPEGPNRTYTTQLLSTVRQDVTKLSRDRGILHAGLLLILFVRDEATARHDLDIWQDRCLARGLPIGAPSQRVLSMNDRLGNGICVVSLYPVGHY